MDKDVNKEQYVVIVPFSYGVGDTLMEAVENVIEHSRLQGYCKILSAEEGHLLRGFKGKDISVNGMGGVTGIDLVEIPEEEVKYEWDWSLFHKFESALTDLDTLRQYYYGHDDRREERFHNTLYDYIGTKLEEKAMDRNR